MSGNIVSAEGGALDKGVEFVQHAHGQIQRKLTELESDLAEVSKVWTGPAASAFHQLMNSWRDEVTSLNKTLSGLEHALRDTETGRAKGEDEHSDTIRGLAGLMGSK